MVNALSRDQRREIKKGADAHVGAKSGRDLQGSGLGKHRQVCAAGPIRPNHLWQQKSAGGWTAPEPQISSRCVRCMLSKTAHGLARRRRNKSIRVIPTQFRSHVLKRHSAQISDTRGLADLSTNQTPGRQQAKPIPTRLLQYILACIFDIFYKHVAT